MMAAQRLTAAAYFNFQAAALWVTLPARTRSTLAGLISMALRRPLETLPEAVGLSSITLRALILPSRLAVETGPEVITKASLPITQAARARSHSRKPARARS